MYCNYFLLVQFSALSRVHTLLPLPAILTRNGACENKPRVLVRLCHRMQGSTRATDRIGKQNVKKYSTTVIRD